MATIALRRVPAHDAVVHEQDVLALELGRDRVELDAGPSACARPPRA